MFTDFPEIAERYLRYYRENRPEDVWAYDAVCDVEHSNDSALLWKLVKMLLTLCQNNSELAYVAAGPFEELIKLHGLEVLHEIEAFCDQDSRMQLALSGVWLNEKDASFEKWKALMRKYGFLDGREAL